jgi:hypothetical protein
MRRPRIGQTRGGVAIFGMFSVPLSVRRYLANRADHGRRAHFGGDARPFWFSVAAFVLFYALLFTLRVRLEHQRRRSTISISSSRTVPYGERERLVVVMCAILLAAPAFAAQPLRP